MSTVRDIDELLDGIITLPSLPQTLARITDIMEDPDCSIGDVGKVISADPSIALKALRLVNSAHYGLRNEVMSVEHAVMLLGLKVIRNMVLTATVFESFKKGAEGFLRHSVACAVAMKTLADSRGPAFPAQADDAFVYGLLHDVGKVVFQEFLPREMAEVSRLSHANGLPAYRAEREIVGCDHAALGATLATKWKLPPQLIGAIAGHHDPDQCDGPGYRESAALLGVADYICCASGILSGHGVHAPASEALWAASRLVSADIPPVLARFFEASSEISELMDIAS